MHPKPIFRFTIAVSLVLLYSVILSSAANTAETLRYSSSAQVREAFGPEGLKEFSRQTGIEIDLYVGSSASAVHRLMNDFSDIASTVERLDVQQSDDGYVEIPFCKAPLIVITNVQTPVENISTEQLQAIFSGVTTNWKELGGPDKQIVVVVPGKHTGAFKNFQQLALKRLDVKYDFMAYRSTDVVKLVHRLPWSISFISIGAHTINEAIKTIKVDELSPKDEKYPYYQIFSFVTRGEPGGTAKRFIDFAFSPTGQEIIRRNGMTPISK